MLAKLAELRQGFPRFPQPYPVIPSILQPCPALQRYRELYEGYPVVATSAQVWVDIDDFYTSRPQTTGGRYGEVSPDLLPSFARLWFVLSHDITQDAGLPRIARTPIIGGAYE